MTPKEKTLAQFPKSFCFRIGVMKYEIRRPREKQDPPALVNYALVSQLCDSPEKAWEDAEKMAQHDHEPTNKNKGVGILTQ